MVLLLLSLVSMVVLTRQYDAYQLTAAIMQQRNTDKYSENIQAIYPGLAIATEAPCCKTYNITISNLGIDVQIVAIYVNSTPTQQTGTGCRTPCVITPSTTGTPTAYTFPANQSHVNSGEYVHGMVFWLPFTLPRQCPINGVLVTYNCNTITLVTSRGRSFPFQWPMPPLGPGQTSSGKGGGTGIYIGPLVFTYDRALVSYTTSANCVGSDCTPQLPIGGDNGYWIVPSGVVIIYVKLQTDVGVQKDVFLTPQSVLELKVYTSPGQSPAVGSLIAPITPTFCSKFGVNCNSTVPAPNGYGYYDAGNTGNPNNIVQYLTCTPVQLPQNYASCNTPRYRIPKPNAAQLAAKQRGDPVIVAFAFTVGGGINTNWPGKSVLTFLGLTYVWDDSSGTGAYVYGVTLPFVAMCINNGSSKCPG